MPRKPNTNCAFCNKAVYKRPGDIKKFNNIYCSIRCRSDHALSPKKQCKECNNLFQPKNGKQKFCNKSCSGKYTKNRSGTKNGVKTYKNNRERRLGLLLKEFNFTACMVEGCSYNIIYNIHRFIHGSDGGKYEIGNMFAICPNHHAECHGGFIEFNKKNNFTLAIIKVIK